MTRRKRRWPIRRPLKPRGPRHYGRGLSVSSDVVEHLLRRHKVRVPGCEICEQRPRNGRARLA